jgi:hypothetical protein
MEPHPPFSENPPVQAASEVPGTRTLIGPLLQSKSPHLIASHHPIRLDGTVFELPKLLLLGERGGGDPLRIALFAGIEHRSVDTIAAATQLLGKLDILPSLARDYALFAYPLTNPPAFRRPKPLYNIENR